MKRILPIAIITIVAATACVLASANPCFAQKKTIQDTVYCPTQITVTLFFEAGWSYFEGDKEGEDYTYEGDTQEYKYIYITAINEDMLTAKLLVKTLEGTVYELVVINRFEDKSYYEFASVKKMMSDSLSVLYDIEQKKEDSVRLALQEKKIGKILENTTVKFKGIGMIDPKAKVTVQLDNIITNSRGKERYFVISVYNNSKVEYEIDVFFISLKTFSKKGTNQVSQEESVYPKFTSELGIVEPGSRKRVVLAVPLYSPGDTQKYAVKMSQIDGAREFEFDISPEDLGNTDLIQFN